MTGHHALGEQTTSAIPPVPTETCALSILADISAVQVRDQPPTSEPSTSEPSASQPSALTRVQVRDDTVNSMGNIYIVKDLPITHCIIHKSSHKKLENLAEKYRQLVRARSKKKYCGSQLGRRYLGAAAALAPQLSLYKLQFMIPLIVAAHYADAGLDIDKMLLCSSLPSANALKECLLDVATDSIVQLRNELHGNSWVYIMFDKGQDNNLCKR